MIDPVGVVVAALAWIAATAVAAAIAYRVGYRSARRPFPQELRDDLARHKRECLREAPERVERELALYLGPPRGDDDVPARGSRRVAAGAERQGTSTDQRRPASASGR